MAEMSLEDARFLDDLVSAGRFENRQAAIEEAIRLLRSEIQENIRNPIDSLTASEWCERFETWASSHRDLPHEADDSRESIYAGRGE